MGRRPHLPGLCGRAGYTNKSPYERGRGVRIREGSVVTEAEVRGTEREMKMLVALKMEEEASRRSKKQERGFSPELLEGTQPSDTSTVGFLNSRTQATKRVLF